MKKILLSVFLVLTFIISLSSCSFLNTNDDGLFIKSIASETQEDGSIKMTIYYTDETVEPTVVIIPKGSNGENGVGITKIDYEKSEDGKATNVTISYTDATIDPVTFSIPSGVSVSGIASKEEGDNIILTVEFSDGTKSDSISLPKGKAGNGISSVGKVENEDGSTTLTFKFTESDDLVVNIPKGTKGEDGKDGNGITTIQSSEEGTTYKLTITYSDGKTQEVTFNKPSDPSRWYTSSSKPSDTDGKDGDYCFDKIHKIIYANETGTWVEVISFDDYANDIYYTITFDVNDSQTAPASMPAGYTNLTYRVKEGTYFIATVNGYTVVPVPSRTGYTFLGWYTSKVVTPTNGAFTDLTPVFSDLTLYAVWHKD